MAKHLRKARIRPELVLCSSSARTRETLALVQASLEGASIEVEDGLYAATADELLDRLRDVPDDVSSVMVIGHNPGLQDLALTLTTPGSNDRLGAKFVTCALATLTLPRWSELKPDAAELRDYVTPKELRRA